MEISKNRMEQVANQYMVKSSKIKILCSIMIKSMFCQWQMQEKTQMVHNFLLPLLIVHGLMAGMLYLEELQKDKQ